MATKSYCDGCAQECGDDALTLVGRYDPCVYCRDCLRVWREAEAAEREAHAALVVEWEAGRARRRAALKAGGLKRLPDEE